MQRRTNPSITLLLPEHAHVRGSPLSLIEISTSELVTKVRVRRLNSLAIVPFALRTIGRDREKRKQIKPRYVTRCLVPARHKSLPVFCTGRNVRGCPQKSVRNSSCMARSLTPKMIFTFKRSQRGRVQRSLLCSFTLNSPSVVVRTFFYLHIYVHGEVTLRSSSDY